MTALISYIVVGISVGAAYALIGSGFVVVHRVTGVVNFAQGTFAVLGGLMASTLLNGVLPHGLGELVAILFAAACGGIVGLIAIGKRATSPQISLVITLGISVLAYAVEVLVWGDAPRSFQGVAGAIEIAGLQIQNQYIFVDLAAGLALVGMAVLFNFTFVGKALTASSSNPWAARLVGINVRRMGIIAFVVAGALGGLAGVLITPLQEISYNSDLLLVLTGFAAAVFGGLGSPGRTALGGVLLGVVGTLVAGYWSGEYQIEVALVVMLIVMVVRSSSRATEEAK